MSHVDDGELTAYADGAYPVSDPVALRISEHLSTCGNCRTRLEQSETLRARASEILALATPLEVTAPAFETLRTHARATTNPRRTMSSLAYAATIIVALGLGWFGRGAWNANPGMQEVATRDVANTSILTEQEEAPAAQPLQAPADQTAAASSAPRRSAGPTGGAVAGRRAGVAATAHDERPLTSAPTIAAAPPPPSAPPSPQEASADVAVAEMAAADLAAPQIAGLPVTRLEVRGDVTTVEQTLPDGQVVTLRIVPESVAAKSLERREAAKSRVANAAEGAAVQMAPGRAQTVVTRNGKIITVSGNLSADSLRALADKIK